jgi:uncharacterized protein
VTPEAAIETEEVPVSKKPIALSPKLHLPVDAVTQTFGILGKRGSGKTTTASVLAEELLRNELPLVIVDPTGAWWGLRSSADGGSEGFPITILGGDHGDGALEETAGKALAELVAEKAPPLVLDLSLLSKSAGRRFVGDFSQRLYEKNRNALHVIYDEADEFVPQRIARGMEGTFGAVDTVVRRGRIRGLGVTLISQRSASINKDVLSQAEVLIAHRASHPRDLEPVLEWMKAAAIPAEQLDKVRETIAALENGEAWVMSPEWLDLFVRTTIRQRTTFNSSATPKAGERRVVPKKLAKVDLDALGAEMKAARERQQANDPAALRREVAQLRAELAKQPAAAPAPAKVERIEVPVLKDGQVKRLEGAVGRMLKAQDGLATEVARLTSLMQAVLRVASPHPALRPAPPPPPARRAFPFVPAPRAARAVADGAGDLGSIGVGERKILTAAAQHPEGVSREQLTVLTGYKRSSRDTYLQRLRARGLVLDGDRIVATETGIAELGDAYQPLPTGSALLEHWRQRLPAGELACLEVAVAKYPEAVDREAISEATSYQRSSRDTYLQRLRSRQLITEPGRGLVRAADALFDGARC